MLSYFYYVRMVGVVPLDFSKIVEVGVNIKNAFKSGRIQGGSDGQASEEKCVSDSQEEENVEVDAIWDSPQILQAQNLNYQNQR